MSGGVQFLSPRSAFKARESEDALKKNSAEPTRGRRHTSIKFGSTLSLGSRSVKETMHAAIARKNERVFGIEVSALLQRERKNMPEQKRGEHTVPYIVSRITEHLQKHGQEASGLFRIPGKHSLIVSACTTIDEGQVITGRYLSNLDIHTVADLLKKYLRDLPRPVIPEEDYFTNFLLSSSISDPQMYHQYIGSLVSSLPEDNRNLLQHICRFFNDLISSADTTKMGSANLAIIFGPLLFGQTEITDSMQLVLEAKTTSKITKTLIDEYQEFFTTTHCPAMFMVATECHTDPSFSLIKGEEIQVFHVHNSADDDDEDVCYAVISGQLIRTTQQMVNSKCKPRDPKRAFYKTPPNKELIQKLRIEALNRIMSQDELTAPSHGHLIPAGKQKNPESSEEKGSFRRSLNPMKSKKRKKSDSFVRADLTSKDQVTPPVAEPLVREKEVKKESKKDKDKEKREKKKQKKIDSTISAWYGATATKSTSGFSLGFRASGSPKSRKRTSSIDLKPEQKKTKLVGWVSFPTDMSKGKGRAPPMKPESSGSEELTSEDEDSSWIQWFCGLSGNEFFCEVDESFIQDDFNLTGLRSIVPNYDYALDLILDSETEGLTEDQQEIVEGAAEFLYGLIHARFILTSAGMMSMLEKYQRIDFGRCPRILCGGQPVLPCGQSDQSRTNTVKIFCPKCEDLYYPRNRRHCHLDGAYFGTTFCHLFLQTNPQLRPPRSEDKYVPRIYGFKVHPSAREREEEEKQKQQQQLRAALPAVRRQESPGSLPATKKGKR